MNSPVVDVTNNRGNTPLRPLFFVDVSDSHRWKERWTVGWLGLG
ncbi:hypothetical protein [Halocatena marina]|nr:hypothetical protein [Halocatena marina]